MTQRYAHLSPAHKFDAVQRLTRRTAGTTTGTRPAAADELLEAPRIPPVRVMYAADGRAVEYGPVGVDPTVNEAITQRRANLEEGRPPWQRKQ